VPERATLLCAPLRFVSVGETGSPMAVLTSDERT
jgi:hypothetical protein